MIQYLQKCYTLHLIVPNVRLMFMNNLDLLKLNIRLSSLSEVNPFIQEL
jgi:hypothetical protein